MKKLSVKLVIVLFLSLLISACGNDASVDNNDVSTTDSTIVVDDNDTNIDDATVQDGFNTIDDYTIFSSKDDLIAEFGQNNLVDGVQYYAEGTVVIESTTLTNPQNNQVIIFEWDDDDNLSSVVANYAIYDENYQQIGTQKIETNDGLFLGMSLSELRTWNGEDFSFSGFGWDYGGAIFVKDGSKISNSNFGIVLDILDYDFDYALGDIELNADDENLEDAGIYVSILVYYVN